ALLIQTLQHGFPHKPTAVAWDPSLRLICIGTATGAVKVFGRPGVEFYGQHQNPIAVTKVTFLPNQGRVVTLCDDNSLHLWEVNKSSLVEVKQQALEGKLKKISTICLESAGKHLLLGTEGGNIYLLDLATFTMTPDIIYQDVVMQNVPQDYKLNPGAVESIFEQPEQPNNILIGYNRGLIVLWNRVDNNAVKTFISNQQLEALCWKDEKYFLSSHNDGSYMEWNIDQTDKPCGEPVTTYGPYSCRAIPKILAKEFNGEPLIVFSGGLPRANFSDKYSVSVVHGDKHVAFDFTSKVIDFLLIESGGSDEESLDENESNEEDSVTNGDARKGEPEALIVLAEEELVVIDLRDENWKMMNLPYLVSLHASAVTCSQYVSGVPEELWEHLKDAGRVQTSHLYSNRAWPINGGQLLCSKGAMPKRELLLTGHEDGTVRFWDAGGVTLTPIYKFGTAQFFAGDDLEEVHPDPEDMEEEWPPFRKTGVFDPYSDDPRLAVKKVIMCPLSGTLVVAGTAGQVVIAKFDTEVLGRSPQGHRHEHSDIHQTRGFQANSILQLHPPAAVTCCILQADWGLVAAGTAHGLAPPGLRQEQAYTDLTGSGGHPDLAPEVLQEVPQGVVQEAAEGPLDQEERQQRGEQAAGVVPARSQAPGTEGAVQPAGSGSPLSGRSRRGRQTTRWAPSSGASTSPGPSSSVNTNPTLWAGTNNGTVYAFTITVPSASKRETDDVACHLAKEIQLKHRAPVIAIAVLDGSNKPLPEPLEVEKGVAPLPDTTQAHRVIIASEEQFKIFTLPSLKPFCKCQSEEDGFRDLLLHYGQYNAFRSGSALPNKHGRLPRSKHSRPEAATERSRHQAGRHKRNLFPGFHEGGAGVVPPPSSELQRISLAANSITMARCYLPLPVGAREDAASETGSGNENDAQDNSTEAPLVNGSAESKEGSLADKSEDVRSNCEETLHNVTVSSSVGDITIDSVKDHLGSGEELHRRISGLCVTKTVTTVVSSTQGGGRDLEHHDHDNDGPRQQLRRYK
ncbi:hypothetical protein NQ318_012851, partial [Aromia moschata]